MPKILMSLIKKLSVSFSDFLKLMWAPNHQNKAPHQWKINIFCQYVQLNKSKSVIICLILL